MGNPFPGPQTPYQNPPINPQYYIPSQFFISNISNGTTTIITTTENHNYVVGNLCRLLIPVYCGEYQLNEQTGYVISIPSENQVELNIDSTFYDVFVTTTRPNQPQILAIGDLNNGIINPYGRMTAHTYIPGSFINISPV